MVSVRELEEGDPATIIRANNKGPKPFQWVASAKRIIGKVRKYKRT